MEISPYGKGCFYFRGNWIRIPPMQANKVTAKSPMRPDPKSVAGSSIGNGRRGDGGKYESSTGWGGVKPMTEEELQVCVANPTCMCVIAVALPLVRKIKSGLRPSLLRVIASTRAKVGDINGALATAQNIKNHLYHRSESLGDIALEQARAGDINGALGTIRSVDYAGTRILALGNVALTQARAGDAKSAADTFAVAVSEARSIDDVETRANVLCGIALTLMEAGDFKLARDMLADALPVARDICDAYARAKIMSDIALAQVKAGDGQSARNVFDTALSAAQSVDILAGPGGYPLSAAQITHNSAEQGGVIRGIALAQAKAGDFNGAFAVSKHIDYAPGRAMALCDIASTQAKIGDKQSARDTFAAALSIARDVERGVGQRVSLSAVASAKAKMGDVDDAITIVQSIGSASVYRAEALHAIALAQARMGDKQSVQNTLAAMHRIIGEIDNCQFVTHFDYEDALGCASFCIVSAQAQMGDFRGAMKTAMGIFSDSRRAIALTSVAKELAKRTEAEQSRKKSPKSALTSKDTSDPEIIRKVEKAAVAYVRKTLRADGWRVVSVESMKCGYDLHCTRPDGQMHVEVKGTRGDEPSFMLTRGEHERAQSDPKFALYLVLRAMDAPRLVVFSGGELLRKFDFQTVQYKATEK